MKNEINKEILKENNLTFKKKSSATPFILFAVSAATFIGCIFIDNGNDAKMPLLLIASVIAVFGIAKIINLPNVLVMGEKKEELREEELYFDLKEKNHVLETLRSGSLSKLRAEAKDNSNYPLKARVFSNEKGDFIMFRIYHFVPYTFEPVTEFEVYKKE